MKNDKLLAMAKDMLNDVIRSQVELVDITHTQGDDGSSTFAIEVHYPPVEERSKLTIGEFEDYVNKSN